MYNSTLMCDITKIVIHLKNAYVKEDPTSISHFKTKQLRTTQYLNIFVCRVPFISPNFMHRFYSCARVDSLDVTLIISREV